MSVSDETEVSNVTVSARSLGTNSNLMTGKPKAQTCNVTPLLLYTPFSSSLKRSCNIPAWQNEIQRKEDSQRGKCCWVQGRKGRARKSATFFTVQCHGRVPHNSAWWFPVRQEVTSQGHCFSFLYGLHEKRPFSPAAPQYAVCDPHKTVKRNIGHSLCAYCLYTHHMSHRTECHHRMVGTSTSSVGAALLL